MSKVFALGKSETYLTNWPILGLKWTICIQGTQITFMNPNSWEHLF